ncbi:hypothetical protein RKE29_00960 [Streptomyces sp. B1866]|uniref:hypothetical protein n=1 Tax=Streptomyces sp. B1866 TaxID=3075431 RepID=UPI00289283CE|nr:hypothetical protein [Streptomyces sp. B1866]MDT3395232.1 hypothetical protein [Streptomyces sp. B1866]
MSELPVEDQPSGQGLVPAEDDIAAADADDLNDPRNPMAVAFAFYNAVMNEAGPDVKALRLICTPESWSQWGDFSQVREMIGERGLATRADPPSTGETTVRYAKVVTLPNSNQSVISDGYVLVSAHVITMQWRPSDGYWRVHGFGDYIRPEDLPPV